ncbi:hypothetical protein QUA70_28085 [Microcoleus sp. LAD1_D5]|uniref:hypothetical protein n=1 Tax=unclassified Microcoleus TaxID=2642155 RepID=UPI002FD70405
MIKIDLATSKSLEEALLASVDSRARKIILSRPKSDIQRMYQHALTTEAMKRLQRPGKGYCQIELCAPDESLPLATWWEAFLIWHEFNWRVELEPPERLRFSGAIHDTDTGVESVEKIETSAGTRPPPQKPFTSIPKAEIGGCARSDSPAPAI